MVSLNIIIKVPAVPVHDRIRMSLLLLIGGGGSFRLKKG